MWFNQNRFYSGPKSDHFDGTRFFNPSGMKMPTFFDVLRWKMTQDCVKWPKKIDVKKVKPFHVNPNHTFKITYIGHSSFLVQVNGINILVDPIYSLYAGPLKTLKLKRRIPPGIAFEDLPKIHLILISHSHYDHCDLKFLKKITKRDHCQFIVPLGMDKVLGKITKPENIETLDWFEKSEFKDLDIFLTPAHHWSMRSFSDKNKTLWGSFVVKKANSQLFFAGDTGYDSKMFKQIHKKFGSFTCALIPIGAYKPRWFMKSAHMDPYDAVMCHKDIESCFSIAMHHRSFPLTDEGPFDPEYDLKKALSHHAISPDRFVTITEGSQAYV